MEYQRVHWLQLRGINLVKHPIEYFGQMMDIASETNATDVTAQ
jgi:hypothetical protein